MPSGLKHERIVSVLGSEIRNGELRRGTQLPGEVSLARRFAVSRTTVRSALADLNAAGLITTHNGKGSYVLYDGRPLDARLGWAKAFAANGVAAQARIVKIAADRRPDLADSLSLGDPDFIVVERIRELATGEAISWERSWIPAVGRLRDLPGAGLANISLTEALASVGLFADHGTQRVGGRQITGAEAAVLRREPGTWFLKMDHTCWSATDEFVEHVECLLDAHHFELSLAFTAKDA
jgi:GntR family transcriptional regulator